MAAAENPHAEVFTAGQYVPVDHVLCGLAENPALPSDLVDRLVAIADEDIAVNLAGRTDLPPEVYELLADSPEPGVRGTLAENSRDPGGD